MLKECKLDKGKFEKSEDDDSIYFDLDSLINFFVLSEEIKIEC